MEPKIFNWRSITGHRTRASAVVLGVMLVLSLFAVSVWRHPESIEGGRGCFLVIDIVLVFIYGVFGVCIALQRSAKANIALNVGALVGLILGLINIAHHFIEFLVPFRGRMASVLLGAGHVLLMFALFSVAGSLAWERTRAIGLATIAALWSALLSVSMLLVFAFFLLLAFESRAELELQEAFLASGMNDPGAFLVKNSLEAASEALIRMPALALLFSLAGALANAWMSRLTRTLALAAAFLVPVAFMAGAALLWYADSLERASRPPFVMAGLLLAGFSLVGIHAIWCALRRTHATTEA